MKKIFFFIFIQTLLAHFSWAQELGQEKGTAAIPDQNVTTPKKKILPEKLLTAFEDINLSDIYNNLSLRAGATTMWTTVNAENGSEDHHSSFGINTQFGYTSRKWEVLANSYISYGKIKALHFNVEGVNVVAAGSLRTLFFAPMFKYITDWHIKPAWHFYFTLGPTWSVQSLKLSPFMYRDGKTRHDHRLNYESRGGIAGIGLQEMLPFKQMHPVYIELLYTYSRAYKLTLVDASNYKEVEKVFAEDTSFRVFDSLIMINMGIILF